MFTWLGEKVSTILSTYVLEVVSKLCTMLAPMVLISMTVWILLFGYSVLRGEVNETVPQFVWKLVKLSMIFAVALQSGLYISTIAESAKDLALSVATAFVPAGSPAELVTSPYELLDEFNTSASKQTFDILKEASLLRLDLVFATIAFAFGSVAFLCIAVFVVTLSTALLTFVLGIGPVFVFALAWKPTQRFFDSWVSMLLNAVVLTWFSFFTLGLSTYLGREVFLAIEEGGGFLGPNLNVLGESLRYCVLMLVMAILCFQAPALAAALTGGPVVQQGIQMLQNALIVSGLRKGNKTVSSLTGGSIRGGGGVPYTAGYLVGRGVGAAARAARAARDAASGSHQPNRPR
ncbi:conjugal transfer protein TrbL [Rubrivivax gelatinosus]|nr:conjugal transfer protein TrbL [Rubrivivax gelatinosus]